jgi:hypothetical protein
MLPTVHVPEPLDEELELELDDVDFDELLVELVEFELD